MREMRELQVAIAAGDEAVRNRVRAVVLSGHNSRIAGECASAEEARELLGKVPVDVLVLDCALPGGGGIGFVHTLGPDHRPAVIFTAGSGEHAVAAFQFHPLDYLTHPIDDSRLMMALERAAVQISAAARALMTGPRGIAAPDAPPQPKRLMVKSAGRICFLKAEEIDWIEAERDYVRLHNGQRKHLLRGTISGMERQLQGERFIRIHRSTIVNVDRIREMQPLSYGEYAVILQDGTRLTMSRSFRERVFEQMMTAA